MPGDAFDHVRFGKGIWKGGSYSQPGSGAAAPQAPFEWSGIFDYLALSSAELVQYLGVDGSISPDIGDNSHLWQADVPLGYVEDVGTLEDGTKWDLLTTATTETTDADFGGGVRDVLELSGPTGNLLQRGTDDTPSPSDMTKSFMVGFVGRIDAWPAGASSRDLLFNWKVSGANQGWRLYVIYPSGTLVLKLITSTEATNVVITPGIALGEAFAVIANVDIKAKKLRIISGGGGFSEVSFPATGVFDQSSLQPIQMAAHTYSPGWDGIFAQAFTLEYASTLDANLGEDSMIQFLKYSDGYLTV